MIGSDWDQMVSRALCTLKPPSRHELSGGTSLSSKAESTERSYVERLVKCDKFVLDRWRFSESADLDIKNRFHLLVVLSGCVRIEEELLRPGQTLLAPAVCQQLKLMPSEPTVNARHLSPFVNSPCLTLQDV